MSYKIIRGGLIGLIANTVANIVTFGTVQPENIIVGLVAGILLGVVLP